MLSSKRIGIIASVLIGAAIAFVVYMLVNPVQTGENHGIVTYENGQSIEFLDSDYYSDYTSRSYSKIALGDGDVTISSAGVYELSGNLNGSINVDAQGGGVVELVLNGAHITADSGSAIYVNQASKTVISLPAGSENTIADSAVRDDTAVSGAIYCRDDLVICGEGALTINANFADGVKANDSLKITGGNINITAVDEGINANDYLALMGGNIRITSGGHSVKCANDEDSSLGFVVLDGAKLNIVSESDGIQAVGDIYVNKTETAISAADDGVHTEGTLFLNGGSIDITRCTEGFEGKYIIMNDGEYVVVSSDDGLNATGEGSMMPGGFGGRGGMDTNAGEVYMTINGGTLHAEVGGDGLDANGAAKINGGFIEVYGPENSGNSTLDFDGGFVINGGTVIAAGSSGMAESPSDNSEQNTIVLTLSQTYQAGTAFSLVDESGTEIAGGTPSKRFEWLCISSSDIKTDGIYTLLVNGEKEATVIVSGAVTTVGERIWGGNFR